MKGRPNKLVADELGAAEKTIKIHRARVMEKMEVRSLADLVRLVVRSEADEPESLALPQPRTSTPTQYSDREPASLGK
nr:LuxR C-terminal-related transcriptional regulator [Paraburkholderia sp. CNPSo 3274]